MTEFIKLYKTTDCIKKRVGSKMDGGYVILDKLTNYDLFISCGIDNNIEFEIDFLSSYNDLSCLAFDGTINNIPNNPKNIQFIKKNITDKDTENTTTLREYITNYNNIFLKMDIETWEYRWLYIITEDELKKFSQIVIEIHFPWTEEGNVFLAFSGKIFSVNNKLELIKKFFIHHKLFHIHGNSACGAVEFNNKLLQNNIECTFVRNDLISNCELDYNEIPDPILDNINLENTSEIKFSIN